MTPRKTLLALAFLLLPLAACGEDDGGPTANAPAIGALSIECGPFAGMGDPKADGDILLSASVTVTDADGDLASVTLTYDGAIIALTEGEGGNFAYDQAGSNNALARCTGSESIVIRALDDAGNTSIFRGTSGQ